MFDSIAGSLVGARLRVRGAFHPAPADGAPQGVETIVLIGSLGSSFWPAFQAQRRDEPHPLDNWTRRVVEPVAQKLGAVALYPFDGPPWHPFQRWAMTAEGLRPAPIGPLIHPEYGPWHSYRAALAFAQKLALPDPPPVRDLCRACAEKPCLRACPADVFARGSYDVPRCAAQLRLPGNDCLSGGCLARRACPVGAGHAYSKAQAAFHTAAFLRSMDSPA